jgi:DNA-binding transcriptional LysR family regulator
MRVDLSMLQLREVLSAGLGVHFLACFEGDTDPSLARIQPADAQHSRDLWLLTLPELRNTSRIRAFMEHMEERMRADRDLRG